MLKLPMTKGPVKPACQRSVRYADGWCDVPVYQRENFLQGDKIIGPAVIEESASVTVLKSGHNLEVDGFGNLTISA
jgi:N-methylhydantoinase A